MFKYILGNKVIETTEKVYEKRFKELGYVPYEDKKSNKGKNKKSEVVEETTPVVEETNEEILESEVVEEIESEE